MTSQPRVRSLSTLSAFVGAVLCAGVAFSVRILNAHEATAKASVAATSVIEWAAPASAGATAGSATYDSEPVVTPLWRMRLPGLVNSERAQLRPASVVVPAFGPRQPLIASVPRDTQKEVFAPETLLVSASNSLWPLHARVISTTTDGASHVVVVSDRLGQALPSADTLQVFGPIRLILPDARFRIRIESLGGDLYFRTSRLPSPDGNGQWLGEMLGRDFIASREVTGESVTFRFNGKGIMHGQRVP